MILTTGTISHFSILGRDGGRAIVAMYHCASGQVYDIVIYASVYTRSYVKNLTAYIVWKEPVSHACVYFCGQARAAHVFNYLLRTLLSYIAIVNYRLFSPHIISTFVHRVLSAIWNTYTLLCFMPYIRIDRSH